MSDQPRIERAADQDRGITPEEIRAGIARTKRLEADPEFRKREAARIAEAERRSKARGTKFPELARSRKPSLNYLSPEDQVIAARSGKL